MKINFYKTLTTIAIIVAFTFSPNINATNTSSVVVSPNLSINSTNFGAITGSWWFQKKKKQKKGKRCKRRHHHSWKCKNSGGGETPSAPLGGLGILALGAAVFGIRKLRGNKNDKA